MVNQEQNTKNIVELVRTGNKAAILYGPPGTGKTYEAVRVAKILLGYNDEILNDSFEQEYFFPAEKENVQPDRGYYTLVQFHPNYAYEDFIGGIRPNIKGEGISYHLHHGIFKRFCDAARNSSHNYVIIIDEINRADLSAVFGELLYALEYRNKPINIPHFGLFSIPANVYLIGTMNNVDKSLVTFDLALRRRFGFFKLSPNMNALGVILEGAHLEPANIEKYIERCKSLNKKLIGNEYFNLSEEHQVGHAYFAKVIEFLPSINDPDSEGSTITILELEKLWEYHLEPLLEEYLGMSAIDPVIATEVKSLKVDFAKPL